MCGNTIDTHLRYVNSHKLLRMKGWIENILTFHTQLFTFTQNENCNLHYQPKVQS